MTIHSTSAQDISSPFHEQSANASPFSKVATRLLSAGYEPLPIDPAGKKPVEINQYGAVAGMVNWAGKSSAHWPQRVDTWLRQDAHAHFNIGVRLSDEIGAVDFDARDDDLGDDLRIILDKLPGARVVKTGAKGWTQFFRLESGIASVQIRAPNRHVDPAGKNPDGLGVAFEILAKGRQTVIPPSIHPDTGRPYSYWSDGDVLEETAPHDLPSLTSAAIEEMRQAVIRRYGLDEQDVAAVAGTTVVRPVSVNSGGSYARTVNDRALANLDAWVHALGLYGLESTKEGYAAVPIWRETSSSKVASLADREPALGISYKGIKDFVTAEKFSPLDLVMRATGMMLGEALTWLFARVGDGLSDDESAIAQLNERLAASAALKAANDNPATIEEEAHTQNEYEMPATATADNVIEFPEAPAPAPSGFEDIVPPFLSKYMPAMYLPGYAEAGLAAQFADWCYDAADVPQATFARMAALATTAAIYGRKFLTPTGGGLNLYMCGIGGSGYGKEFPLKAIGRAMHAHDGAAVRHLGPGDFSSDAALYKVLDGKPSCVVALDEIGMFLGGAQARNASPHEQRIKKSLLELYGSSSSYWTGRFTAAEKERETLHMPTLTIAGMTTPTELTAAISEGNLKDGLLARFVFFRATGRGSDDFNFNRNPTAVPYGIVKQIERAFTTIPEACHGGNIEQEAYYVATMKPNVGIVPWADDTAKSCWNDIYKWCRRLEREGRVPGGLVNRVAENILRIATLLELSMSDAKAAVHEEAILHAAAWVFEGLLAILEEIEENHASSIPEAHRKAVLKVIRKPPQGKASATRKIILNRCRGLHEKEIDAALARLVGEGTIIRETGNHAGKPFDRYVMAS